MVIKTLCYRQFLRADKYLYDVLIDNKITVFYQSDILEENFDSIEFIYINGTKGDQTNLVHAPRGRCSQEFG